MDFLLQKLLARPRRARDFHAFAVSIESECDGAHSLECDVARDAFPIIHNIVNGISHRVHYPLLFSFKKEGHY